MQFFPNNMLHLQSTTPLNHPKPVKVTIILIKFYSSNHIITMAKKQKIGFNSESIKSGLDTALDITIKAGQILAAAATVVTAAKTIKGGNK